MEGLKTTRPQGLPVQSTPLTQRTSVTEARRSLTGALSHESALLLSVSCLWLLVACVFASAQEIWVDETTQLSGLTLGPIEVVSWLLGDRHGRFDVPMDRMPPVSYWIGWLWSLLFGGSENSLRVMGIASVGVAAGFVASAARRAWGPGAGWVAGIGFVLSPNVIVSGVEIRAYPILLLFAAVASWLLIDLSEEREARRPRRWVALSLVCVAAAYTHFFGLVLAGALYLGALSFEAVRKHALTFWAVSGAAVVASALGLFPFVQAAMNISPSGTEPKSVLVSAVRLAYRTAGGHPALAVYVPLLAMGLVGAAILFGAALLPKPRASVARALVISLGAGFAVVTLAKMATQSFEAHSISYNLWMLPPVFLVMGSAMALREVRLRRVALAGAGLLWAGNAGATLVLLNNSSTFAHTAAERVMERIQSAGSSELVVVHDGSGVWGHSYFPLRYAFGRELRQYVAEREASGRLVFKPLPEMNSVLEASSLTGKRVLLIGSQHQHTDQLTRYIKGDRIESFRNESLGEVLREVGFREDGSETLVAYVASDLLWMSR